MDWVVGLPNPNGAIEENEAAKRRITAWTNDGTKRLYALSEIVQSSTQTLVRKMLEEDFYSERRCVEGVHNKLRGPSQSVRTKERDLGRVGGTRNAGCSNGDSPTPVCSTDKGF